MIKNGMVVYYIEEGRVYDGHIQEIQEQQGNVTFEIDAYGTCEGQYRIDSQQIGRTVFLTKQEAMAHITQ